MANRSRLILCVDDEVVGLQVRKILLERAGYEVLTALDGRTGLEIFASQPVQAVILDYTMPGMNGGEVANRMRQTKPEIPILLLSANIALPADITTMVDVYMTKGEGAPLFLQKVKTMLPDKPEKSDGTAPNKT
jgi:CheY-like chemotaxis protein